MRGAFMRMMRRFRVRMGVMDVVFLACGCSL